MNPSLSLGLVMLALPALAACMVGPDYAGPPAAAPVAAKRATFVRAEETTIPAQLQSNWWRAFGDPALDGLVETAMSANTEVATSIARLGGARAMLRGSVAEQGPTGSAGGGYTRSLPSFAQFGIASFPGLTLKDFDLYQANFDASWEIDLFGGKRRAVEAASGRTKAALADIADIRLSIAAETAEAYLALRGQQARLKLLTRSSDLDAEQIALTQTRIIDGTASSLDLARIVAQQQATLAEIPSVRAAITVQLDRLAVLTAREPGALDTELEKGAPLPMPPAKVAVGDPAGLLRRRPDIRAAEQRLAADTASIGVATADLFPKVTLTGSIGLDADSIARFPTHQSLIYSVGPSISWAVLDYSRIHARIDQAGAERDAALAQYQGVVLDALRDAESALTRYSRQIETVAARRRAVDSAERAAALAALRYREGAASSLETLDADRQRLAADDQLNAAEVDLSTDYVALQKSLGLAWDGDQT